MGICLINSQMVIARTATLNRSDAGNRAYFGQQACATTNDINAGDAVTITEPHQRGNSGARVNEGR